MASWVKCTRKVDNALLYVNLDLAVSVRWNDLEGFTAVSFGGGKENTVRILEHPDDLVKAEGSAGNGKKTRRAETAP
ncbi:MAG: hypothetical protein WBD95_24585 [Xanthobacteraceae bacterium]